MSDLGFGVAIPVTVRFNVVGWNSEECDCRESELLELKRYVAGAASSGLEAVLIQNDLLDYGSLFQSVDVDMVKGASGIVVTVIAIASGRSDLVELEPVRARNLRLVA